MRLNFQVFDVFVVGPNFGLHIQHVKAAGLSDLHRHENILGGISAAVQNEYSLAHTEEIVSTNCLFEMTMVSTFRHVRRLAINNLSAAHFALQKTNTSMTSY